MTDATAPYLSIVAAARNDDHGGDLLRRMQIFVDGLAEQCARFSLPAELVLVEWNPPNDQPRLIESLRWPSERSPLTVRLIEVSRAVHERFQHSDRLPLFQMIAKNVGIRRSRAPFVLATNIDLLFSDALMRYIAQRRLRPNRMYRVDRYDSAAGVPPDADVAARLDYCQQNVLRVNRRHVVEDCRHGEHHVIYWRMSWRVWLLERLQDLGLVPIVTRKRVHVSASGDFTLMARENWEKLRGYPELEMFSMHLDAVFCMAAHFGGAREKYLPDPMRIYHIEHGAGWSPQGERMLNERLAAQGIEQLSHEQYHRWAIQMRRERAPMIFNEASWGLADEQLPECVANATRAHDATDDARSAASRDRAPALAADV